MQLIFCGGTNLSKAYGLIERMSDDADLKVVLPDTAQASHAQVRRRLSALKTQVTDTLTRIGLVAVIKPSMRRWWRWPRRSRRKFSRFCAATPSIALGLCAKPGIQPWFGICTTCTVQRQPEVLDAARRAFPVLVSSEKMEFATQFPDFAAAPPRVLIGALRQARTDEKIRSEFTGNLLPLVYGGSAPTFEQAFGDFHTVAEALLEALP